MNNVLNGGWGAPNRQPMEEFQPFSPTKWVDRHAPPLDWVVENAFLRGTVAILAGDGGLGKSLILQQLITAAAFGMPWLGMQTKPSRSLAVFCEDDTDELHRRQTAINDYYQVRMSELAPVAIESRAGRDSVLMNFKQWGSDGRRTMLFDQLEYAAKQHKAQIVILDTLADVFSGNEVDRNQPRSFIRELRKLAIAIQGVVILTQHPSVEGVSSGTGRSGSTGWNNSVRSRLYLTMPKRKPDDETPTNDRLLKGMKNNHGKFGTKTEVVWDRGVFKLKQEMEPSPYYAEKDWR